MGIRCTSIAAYRQLQAEGKTDTQRGRLIELLAQYNDASLRELQRAYQRRYGVVLDIGTISARIHALKADGVVAEVFPPRKCSVSDVTINPVQIAPEQINE